jgi:hypothetical protein
MIVFDLICGEDHRFEAWFRDGKAYEAQAAAREIVCPMCGDTAVAKAPMTPNLARGAAPRESVDPAKVMRGLEALRDEVEKNFDNVGERFPEEARKIHYGEVEQRNIYGEASAEEARELREEGVEFGSLPWLRRRDS